MRLASLYYGALQLSGTVALARRLRPGGVILCYHNVVADRDGRAGLGLGLHMAQTTFERQVRWLSRHYELVSLAELVARRARGASLRGVAALTFDDGYAGVLQSAWPWLHDQSIPATVFVVADAPRQRESFWWDHPAAATGPRAEWLTALRGDRTAILAAVGGDAASPPLPSACLPADWEALAAAARSGLDIGVHSATHRALPTLDDDELAREVVASREIVRRHTGVTPEFFAYPYGLWNARVRDAVRAAGYKAAFTLDGSARRTDLWSLPRVNVPAGIADAAFQVWTAGLAPRRRP